LKYCDLKSYPSPPLRWLRGNSPCMHCRPERLPCVIGLTHGPLYWCVNTEVHGSLHTCCQSSATVSNMASFLHHWYAHEEFGARRKKIIKIHTKHILMNAKINVIQVYSTSKICEAYKTLITFTKFVLFSYTLLTSFYFSNLFKIKKLHKQR